MKVLVTGGNGFVGSALLAYLSQSGLELAGLCRRGTDGPLSFEQHIVEDLTALDDWFALLQSVDVVVHCAGLSRTTAGETELNAVNVELTLRLAKACGEAGVTRFVFLSSLKALGETTSTGKPFNSRTVAKPQDAYGRSKLQAEQQLHQLAGSNGLELVIIRPPLVYGPGVKANFQLLQKIARLPLPLPFSCIDNRRDVVSLDNLCSLIERCLTHPAAVGTWLVSDGKPYSLAELIITMRRSIARSRWLFPVPVCWLFGLLRLLGRGDMADRLMGNLEVDTTETERLLGWQPVVTLEQTLQKMNAGNKTK